MRRPWPVWVHTDDALAHVGRSLRRYHDVVAAFVPPQGAFWRTSRRPWQPGDIIGHNDSAPYNAVWQDGNRNPVDVLGGVRGRLVGFVDWDLATPVPSLLDLAYMAFGWVPLHDRDVVSAEGFTHFGDRPRRLQLLLDAYGYQGDIDALLDEVRTRVMQHAAGIRELTAGDPLLSRLIRLGFIDGLNRALAQLEADTPMLHGTVN